MGATRRLMLALALALATTAAIAQDRPETAQAILAGGCFWCVEHDLESLPGVTEVVSGYTGGTRPTPTYKNYNRVDAGNPTPHVEVVQVTYDPEVLSHEALLDAFLRRIDPTDSGGQFCDRGAAYRPAIFTANPDERQAAEAALARVSQRLATETPVEIIDAAPFWPAEAYHQDYAAKNPLQYRFYRWNCGRDQRVRELWGGVAD